MKNIPEIKKYKDGKLTESIEELPVNVEIDGYTFEISDVGVVTEKGEGSDPTPPTEEDEVIPGKIVEGSNKTYTDIDGDTAVIPVGFAVSEEEGEQLIDEGLVIKDEAGNEFVWIPINDSYEANITYIKTELSTKLTPDENYLPAGIDVVDGKAEKEVENDLVNKNMLEKYGIKGFYISRYEAGDGSAEVNRTSVTEGTLVSKKGAYVYTYIKQTDDGTESGVLGAKEKAKKFINKEYVKSGLCTGIQWDMVMTFVNGKKGGKGTETYNVVEAYSKRHEGEIIGVERCGSNEYDKVCNIYDLEGNCFEYVAEKNNYDTNYSYVVRGGCYGSNNSASDRNNSNGNAENSISFRFVLYVM